MRRTILILVLIGVALLVITLLGPYYLLTEGEQAVVVQFGKIVRVDTSAGVHYKAPFVESALDSVPATLAREVFLLISLMTLASRTASRNGFLEMTFRTSESITSSSRPWACVMEPTDS